MDAQLARWRRLGRSAAAVQRNPGRVTVTFGPDLDRALLEDTLAVERECCPFFRFEVGERRLGISVAEPADEPGLDALAYALSG
jgi:hypothetical protein